MNLHPDSPVLAIEAELKFTPSEDSKELAVKPDDLAVPLNKTLFTQDESQLRAHSQMIAKDSNLLQTYIDSVLASRSIHETPKHDHSVTTAASNAISILNYGSRSGIFPFRFIDIRDWSGIRVPKANLNFAIMAHCNLDNADLSESTIINIILFGAKLRRTNLSGVISHDLVRIKLREHPKLCVHPDGTIAASESPNAGVIRIFDLATNEDIHYLFGHTARLLLIRFSHDGSCLGSFDQDGTVRIWDLTTYECRSILQIDPDNVERVKHITFNSDNSNIAAVVDWDTIGVGNVDTCEWTMTFEHGDVMNVEWSPSHKHRLLSYSCEGVVCVWNVATQPCMLEWCTESKTAYNAKFTLDGTKVVATNISEVVIFDVTTGISIAKIPLGASTVTRFALDRRFIYASTLGWIYVVSLEAYRYITRFLDAPNSPHLFPTVNGQKLITYYDGGRMIKMFDLTTLRCCFPTIVKHNSLYSNFAFSPDNRRIVMSCNGDRDQLRFLDVVSCHEVATVTTSNCYDEISILSWCPNNRLIAFVRPGYTSIVVYDVEERKCIKFLHERAVQVACLAFSTQGILASSASNDVEYPQDNGNILLWHTETWKCTVLRGHRDEAYQMCFSPNGNTLVTASRDGMVRMWDVRTNECLRTIYGPDGCFASVSISYSPCGRFFATGEFGSYVRIWDATNGKCIKTFRETDGYMAGDVHFLRNGRLLSVYNKYRIYDIFSSRYEDLPLNVRNSKVNTSLDRRVMAVKADQYARNELSLWKFPEGHWHSKVILTTDSNAPQVCAAMQTREGLRGARECIIASPLDEHGSICINSASKGDVPSILQGHSDRVTCLQLSPNAPYLVSGSRDTVCLWSLESMQCMVVFEGHTAAVSCVQISYDDQIIASGSDDMTIRIWSIAEHKTITVFEGHTTPIQQIVFSPDNRYIASIGSGDPAIRVWEITTGICSAVFDQHTADIFDIQFSSDAAYLASGSHDDSVRIWKLQSGECVSTLRGHSDCLTCFAFGSDGKTIVTGSEDKTVRIWNIWTGQCNLVLEGHMGYVRSLCLTPDDRCVISASNDTVIHIWDVQTGGMLHQLTGHCGGITSVRLVDYESQGKSTIISTSTDGTARLWSISEMASPVAYLPELCGVFGPQARIELAGADLTDVVMDSSFSQLLDFYCDK